MATNSGTYTPPGVFTSSDFSAPTAASVDALKIPVFIGEGNELLTHSQLELVRGSSASVDQTIVSEDETGRMVVSISSTGVVTLGAFNGVLDKFQVAHYPITSGDGTGLATTNRSDVSVSINNQPVVIRAVDGTRGIIQISQPPLPTDTVRCTYHFKRTDTLITDDVSEQVDPGLAIVRALFGIGDVNAPNPTSPVTVLDLHDDVLDSLGRVTVPANNVLTLTVDGLTSSIRIPPRTNYTMAQVASAITAARVQSLTGTTYVDNYGHSTLQLSAANSLIVLDASANGILGFNKGQQAPRVATFYTFQGPIVTGSGGGVTATDPSQVVVKVNGSQVIPVSVDGANRAVTLAVAPAANARVSIQYYFNSWQDTFDYLENVGVTKVISCGDSPDSSSYVQGADFILQDDKILWGTAVTTESGIHTDLATYFGTEQTTTLLVDNRTFMSECSAVVVAGSASQTTFQLPFDPTLGNGRDTPLGQSLFQTVSNSRIDLPVNRPDVVWAYWGWDAQDALERGKVTVLKVEGNVITLAQPIPVGSKLFATFYYNTLTDDVFTLTCAIPGASGIGTYTMTRTGDVPVYGATFSPGSKGASLTGVTLEFPSGSELTPDVHFEGLSGNYFTGPVTETVTVTLASREATPARFTAPGSGPYEFINNQSDHLRMSIHTTDLGTAGLDLDNPSEHNGGFFASLVGNEVGYTNGQTYDIPSSEEVILTLDGVDVLAKTSDSLTGVDVSVFADAINEAASGHQGLAVGGTTGVTETITLQVTKRSNLVGRYVGWVVVIGDHTLGGATPGQSCTITGYTTGGVATVTPAWDGGAPAASTPYYIYDPAARAALAGATVFDGPVTLADNKHDRLIVGYTGAISGGALLSCVVSKDTAVATGFIVLGAIAAGDNFDISGPAGPAVHFTYNDAPGHPVAASGEYKDQATMILAINEVTTIRPALETAFGHGTEYITASASGTSTVILTYSVAGHSAAGYHGLDPTLTIIGGTHLTVNPMTFSVADYTFSTVTELATGVTAALAIAVADAVVGTPDLKGLSVDCSANAENKLEFRVQLPGLDSAGYLQFGAGSSAIDFSVLAGLDTASGPGLGQAALLQGPVAKTYECPLSGAMKPYDRLILRNRILPGGGPNSSMNAASVVAQTGLEVKAASTKSGLDIGMFGLAERSATVKAASLASAVSLVGGFDSNAEVQLTFYDGTGSRPANNVFSFTLDGVAVSVNLSAAVGTANIGAVSGGDTITIMGVVFTYAASPVAANRQFNSAATLVASINDSTVQALLLAAIAKSNETVTASCAGSVVTITYSVSGSNGLLVTLATNNSATITLSGTALSMSSGTTVRVLGPATSAGHYSVMDQIQDALAAVAGAPFGTRAAIYNAKIVRQEGCGIRITGVASDTTAGVSIGSGSANATLGFSQGQAAYRTNVPAKVLASALNANRDSTFLNYMTDFTATEASKFAKYGFASIETDSTGLEYLYVQDAPALVSGLGAASSLSFADPSPNVANALNYGTALNVSAGDGATGEVAVNGFFVTSNNTSGSGSINTSILNNGIGQDGIVGQTYRDAVTGLTFTLLPRGFHNNSRGPWIAYPTGTNATFRFDSSTTFKTNASIPHLAINGVEMKVSNTVGVAVGDTAIVSSFERGGNEPAIGDLYYVSYYYEKQDFTTGFYRNLSAIERDFGAVSPDNPLSLAAYMAIINGAVVVGLKQVPREAGSNYGSLESYRDAITELEGSLPGQIKPDMITPLRGDSTQLFQILKRSNDIQSSVRYRSERTSIIGMAAGSLPVAAGNLAQTMMHRRMRLVYPDQAVISLQDNSGTSKDYLVDGPYMAAALTGSVVSPNLDVATPWTNRRLVGFTQLGRRLDAVEQNQLAVKGVVILEDQSPFLRVRHGLTTDTTGATTDGNVLLGKLPTITLIADQVQQQTRDVLERFIGVKFLPGILSQIEGTLAALLRQLVSAQIITAYTGVSAKLDPNSPTSILTEAFFAPIFPVEYIRVAFSIRSSL